MDYKVILTCLLIILARLTDVSLGTLRTASIVQGRRMLAFGLGFVEITIWVTVVLHMIKELNSPVYIASYAIGFGLGNYLGITIENWIGFGEQVIRIFTRRKEMAEKLRSMNFRVTEFEGKGRDGVVYQYYLKVQRKETSKVLDIALEMDPESFYVVDDIRKSSKARGGRHYPSGWSAALKRK